MDSLAHFEDTDLPYREKLAVRFAERMAIDHQNVDDEFFAELRREFTDSEIFELGMITGHVHRVRPPLGHAGPGGSGGAGLI